MVKTPPCTLPVMLYRFLFPAAIACGLITPCFSSGEESVPEPSVDISFYQWSTNTSFRQTPPVESREFQLEMKVAGNSPWKVIYCEDKEHALSLKDSTGSSCSGMECRYYASPKPERDRRDGIVYVTADSWLPSPDAVWTEVKGDIPCVVSCATADSESVKIKLEKGFSIPVVLKNAGMEQEGGKGGHDVEAVLEVENYQAGKEEDSGSWLVLQLTSSEKIGFLDFELKAADGTVLSVRTSGRGFGTAKDKYEWNRYLSVEGIEGNELSVTVRHAVNLRRIMAPVDVRSGLFGQMEKMEMKKEGEGHE